jgi:cytidine deaminase
MFKKSTKVTYSVCRFDELTSLQQQLIDKAKEQVQNAYAPYSGFYVGAALELENGEIITANNQENSAYPSGLCAERVAVFYANAQYPDIPVKTLAIAAFTNGEFLKMPVTPCGACRQVLLETELRYETNITILLYGSQESYVISCVKRYVAFELRQLQLQK